jgi:hypothetical protein
VPDWPDPIPGILPFGTLTIFAGAPGVGKTTMIVDWMQRWRDGRSICGHPTHPPTHFYYVGADRGQTREAFYAQLGHADHVTFFSVVLAESGIDYTKFQSPDHGSQLLTHVICQLDPIPGSHLIIDPLAPLFITGDQNRARSVASSLIGMSRLIEERQINITGAWHFSKQKINKTDQYRRPQDRISGSGAVVGFSDTQIYLVDPEPPKQPYYILGWNPRHHPPEEFKFTRQDWFVPYQGLDEIGVEDESDAVRLYRLSGQLGPLPTTELCARAIEALGFSRATFYRLQRALLHDRRLQRLDDRRIQAKVPN